MTFDGDDDISGTTIVIEPIEGGLVIAAVTTPSPLDRRLGRLTPTEAEVTRLLLEGLTNQEIAARRGSSVRTIDGQVYDIFRIFDVQDRGELAWTLVGPDEPRAPRSRRSPRTS
jgi:DNA-binding CsgD family transcriptional regulator